MNREHYDIGQLFGLAFGTSVINVSKTIAKRIESGGDLLNRYSGITVIEDDPDIDIGRKTYLGTDLVYPVLLSGGTYNRYGVTGEVEEVSLEDFELPATTISTFRRAKNISETRMLAGSGTRKEMYGFDDWQIDLQILCLRDPAHPHAKTAFEQHLRILEFENLADSIKVVSSLYNAKGIDAIVIKEITVGQIAGKPGVIPVMIRAASDEPKEAKHIINRITRPEAGTTRPEV